MNAAWTFFSLASFHSCAYLYNSQLWLSRHLRGFMMNVVTYAPVRLLLCRSAAAGCRLPDRLLVVLHFCCIYIYIYIYMRPHIYLICMLGVYAQITALCVLP